MQARYKIILSNPHLYKEIELTSAMQQVRVGTGVDCDVRLRKDLFYTAIELLLVRKGDQWAILCSDDIYLNVGGAKKLMTKKLEHGDVLDVRYHVSDNFAFHIDFLMDFDDGKRKYERCIDLADSATVTIGQGADNNISITSPYINGDTLRLTRKGRKYVLEIQKATYGVYVNGIRAGSGTVIGDGDFLSLSDYFFYYKDGSLWTEIREDLVVHGYAYTDRPARGEYPKFNRSSRLKTVVDTEKIEFLDPPEKPQKPKANLLLKLMPSLGMLVASGAMAYMNGRMVAMSMITGVMSIVTAVLTVLENNRDYKKQVANRIEKYNAYVARKREEITGFRNEEREQLDRIYTSHEQELQRFEEFSSDLFDRSPKDEDFLCLRLGSGNVESCRPVACKRQERLDAEDELQMLPGQVSREFKYVRDGAVVCDLKQLNALGIVGRPEYRFSMMKNMVIDLAARQYYSDVKMLFVAEKKNKDKIYWLRLLPHVNNELLGIRNMVWDDENKNLVFEYLYKELTARAQMKGKFQGERIVIFFYDDCGFKNHPISRFVEQAQQLGVTFVFFGDRLADIPQGCGSVVSIEDGEKAVLLSADNVMNGVSFTYPSISDQQAEEVVRLLAPVYTEEISLEGTLTKNISLFELLNILAVDDLDLKKRWTGSQVHKSMAAPLGVSKTGVVSLDLHDKAHGPHGLVAGTTGSGKSEILQTYILAMATLYHPYEVAFVIIDFKGGGMVNQFKDLPHLRGAITNIDGREINRSLKAIKAELQKRQRLFAEADVNHIDKYIKKYQAGEVDEPLPHLIIIVDEFAELKAEQPEFMKELISAARIGRSLGVHLILATQKPSGQVNEQIWSNSRFKLCLKVQSQEDSNEVLKSPLAAEIKEPGRAYLQVGNNEIFELFQSAYSGASEKADDSRVKEFTIYGYTESGKKVPVYVQKKQKNGEGGATQLEAIVKYVSDYCKKIDLPKLPNICLPKLPDVISVPENMNYTLDSLPLGIYDDPDSQYQGYGTINLQEQNLMVIGASLTGKTNLLQTIIRLASDRFSPEQAVFYIADFGSMYLKNYETLNHVGGVVTASEEEKLKNLYKLLMGEIKLRKAKFMGCGLSSYSSYLEAGYTDLPQIFFMIDNFSGYKAMYGDKYEDQFLYLTREGVSYGITVIVTNATTNGVGYRYLSNFAGRLVFKCNDLGEYSTMFDRCRMEPEDLPGRVLCTMNKEIYEMQTFLAFEGVKEIERSNAVKAYIARTNAKWGDLRARQIPEVPERLTYSYLERNFDCKTTGYTYPFALDYANVDVVSLDMKAYNEICVVGKSQEAKHSVVNSLLTAIHRNALRKPVNLYIIDSVSRPLKSKAELSYVEEYTIDYSEIGSIFEDVTEQLTARYDVMMSDGLEALEKAPQIILLINSKEAVDYISGSKELMASYNRMVKQFKPLGISFIFSDIENANVAYGAPELLKRLKDNKKAIITDALAEFKFCDVPSAAVREHKTINAGDCFFLDGSDLMRIKLAEEG